MSESTRERPAANATWAYNGFLSYSHAEHVQFAAEVQRALHAIARPWYRLRALRVFRDRSSVAPSESLWVSIESALAQSEFLLLLASPRAAQSPWVAREVAWWLEHRGTRNLILVIGNGQVRWDEARRDFDRSASSALPEALLGRFEEEPLWVDIAFMADARGRDRRSRLRAELLAVAARLHHKAPDVLGGEDQRRRRTAYLGAGALTAGAVAALSIGLFTAREAQLREELALREEHAQRVLAARERFERIANAAALSAANGGISPFAAAQLSYPALEAHGDDAQRHRHVLGHWLQYLQPLDQVLRAREPVNWGEQAYLLHDGRVVELEGGRKFWMTMSGDGRLIFTADEVSGRFAIHRPDTGQRVVAVDIGELTLDRELISVYEVADGQALVLTGATQSSSAGGAEARLLVLRVADGAAQWFSPSGFHQVQADATCTQLLFVTSEMLPNDDLDRQVVTAKIAPDGSLRSERRQLPDGPSKLDNGSSIGHDLESRCERFRRAPIKGILEFPAKRVESALWQSVGSKSLADLGAIATSSLDEGSSVAFDGGNGGRPLTSREIDDAIARLQAEVPILEARAEAVLVAPTASAHPNTDPPTPPEVALSITASALLDDLEGGREAGGGRVVGIDTPDGLVLSTWQSSGAQFGEHLYCKLPEPSGPPRCVSYNFHGNFGAARLSPDRSMVAITDMAYMGHPSVAVIDLVTMRELPLPETPQGTISRAAFQTNERRLATLSSGGDLHVFDLGPTPSLRVRASIEVTPTTVTDALEGPAPCFRAVRDRVIYCNAAGGLTALSMLTAEIQWTTPRLVRPGQSTTLLWIDGDDSVGLVGSRDGLLLFRPYDGVVLSDWVKPSALVPRARLVQELALGAVGSVMAKVGGRWYRRLPPLSDEVLAAALADLPCLTGFETGPTVRRATAIHCAARPKK